GGACRRQRAGAAADRRDARPRHPPSCHRGPHRELPCAPAARVDRHGAPQDRLPAAAETGVPGVVRAGDRHGGAERCAGAARPAPAGARLDRAGRARHPVGGDHRHGASRGAERAPRPAPVGTRQRGGGALAGAGHPDRRHRALRGPLHRHGRDHRPAPPSRAPRRRPPPGAGARCGPARRADDGGHGGGHPPHRRGAARGHPARALPARALARRGGQARAPGAGRRRARARALRHLGAVLPRRHRAPGPLRSSV
ncbi:MAG: hypothetical protein AVDCRST_MAG68-1700, partial [uncultured Gemmatimonadetes bacterium]